MIMIEIGIVLSIRKKVTTFIHFKYDTTNWESQLVV